MNARHDAIAACALGACVVACAIAALPGAGDGARTRIAAPRHRVDLACAGAAELGLLPEVGASLAAAIVADRVAHGPVPSVEALSRVPGVGDATLAALRNDACVGGQGRP